MRATLTKKMIEAAITAGTGGKPHVMLWDVAPPGFGLRVRKGGGASWLYTYRPKGSPRGTPARVMTLGTWPALSVGAARVLALGQAGKVAGGGDPAQELRQLRMRERSTVGPALDDYEVELKRRHIVNQSLVMSNLRRGFAPVLAIEVGALDLRTVVGLIDTIATKQKVRKDGSRYTTPGAAKEFRKLAQGFLGWAALKGLTPFNVLAGFRAQKQSREEKRLKKVREGRALDDREIIAVWTATEDLGAFGALVRAGLFTGLRRNELAELRWTDIRDGMIVIPEGKTKMGREHRVPVTTAMRAILSALPRSANSGLVFPSAVTGSAMTGWSKLTPKLVKASGTNFRLHDLRRTCRTIMSRCGVAEAVAEAAIGHVKGGLVAIYDKHDHMAERIKAFELVSAYIAGLINNGDDTAADNVVNLRRN